MCVGRNHPLLTLSPLPTPAAPREGGLRAILNLGHTFGHAMETGQGYGVWLHGEAVAAGTVMAADMSYRLGWIDKSLRDRTVRVGVLEGGRGESVPRLFLVCSLYADINGCGLLLWRLGTAILLVCTTNIHLHSHFHFHSHRRLSWSRPSSPSLLPRK